MKKIINTTFFLLCSFALNAQSQTIVDLKNYDPLLGNNIYYSDISGILDKYEGEWIHTIANFTIKVKFTKRLNQFNDLYGERLNISNDELIMQVIIIENGVETLNTYAMSFDDLTSSTSNAFSDNSTTVLYSEPTTNNICQGCSKGIYGELEINYLGINNGVESIQLLLKDIKKSAFPETYPNGNQVDYTMLLFPQQAMIFIKV